MGKVISGKFEKKSKKKVKKVLKAVGGMSISELHTNLPLPKGCIGVLPVFENKEYAKAFYGNDTQLIYLYNYEEV